jgi:hypothetical protein
LDRVRCSWTSRKAFREASQVRRRLLKYIDSIVATNFATSIIGYTVGCQSLFHAKFHFQWNSSKKRNRCCWLRILPDCYLATSALQELEVTEDRAEAAAVEATGGDSTGDVKGSSECMPPAIGTTIGLP